jgi:hypothetical protein
VWFKVDFVKNEFLIQNTHPTHDMGNVVLDDLNSKLVCGLVMGLGVRL